MRSKPLEKIESGRIKAGHYESPAGELYGLFEITGPSGSVLRIMSSGVDTDFGWEHVSVSVGHRMPNWKEMCFIKDQFWNEDETVIQFHPAKDEYVNCHPHCLHLWRPIYGEIPKPPSMLVGPQLDH